MRFNYKDHILEIEKSETGYYCGYSNDIDWWTWGKKGYGHIVDSFIKAVDTKLEESNSKKSNLSELTEIIEELNLSKKDFDETYEYF